MFAAVRNSKLDGHKKAVTILICFLPLLRYYVPGLGPIMFSDVAQIYLVVMGATRKNDRNYSDHLPIFNSLLLYGAYVVLATAMSAIYIPVFDSATNFTTITRLWIYIIIICFTLDSYYDKEYGFLIALLIALVNSGLTTVQLILFTVFNIKTSFLIPFLNAEAGYSNEHVFLLREFRPTGLFYEPAQTVYYNLPLILILLFSVFHNKQTDEKTRIRNLICAVILTIGIMCTESGAGAVIILIIWACFVLYYLTQTSYRKSVLLFLPILCTIPFVFKFDFFTKAFSRGTNVTGGSGSVRIIRSFITWAQFPNTYKIMGIGYANYSVYVKYAGFFTEYDYIQDVGYTNAAGQILAGLGIFGVLILLAFFYRTLKCCKKDLPSRILILYLFCSLFYSGIFLGIYFLIYMSYMMSRTKPDDHLEFEQIKTQRRT